MVKMSASFNRNVLMLMTGTTIAQAIPIGVSPLLTRLYTPSDFGVFALFISVVSVLGSIVNGRYELAIMMPEKDEDALQVFCLSFMVAFVLSLTTFLLTFLFQEALIARIGSELSSWLYVMPLSVLLMGCFNALTYYNVRGARYKDVASSKVIKSTIMATVQVVLGWALQGASGLMSGHVVAQFFSNMRLTRRLRSKLSFQSFFPTLQMLRLARQYRNFPLLSVPSALLNSTSTHVSSILISVIFSTSTLGLYSLVQRVLGAPSTLIGGSIGQVFFQEALKEKELTGAIREVYQTTLLKLLVVGGATYGLLFFIIEDLFAIIFGPDWRVAGTYAKMVLPFFFFRFVFASLSTTFTIYDRMGVELIIKSVLLLGVLAIFYLFRGAEFEDFLRIYMLFCSCVYLTALGVSYKVAQGVSKR